MKHKIEGNYVMDKKGDWVKFKGPNEKVTVEGGRGPGRPKKDKRGPRPKNEKDMESEFEP